MKFIKNIWEKIVINRYTSAALNWGSEANKGKILSKETRSKMSKVRKKMNIKPPSAKGTKWWNDGCGNSKRAVECPGDGWKLGRK